MANSDRNDNQVPVLILKSNAGDGANVVGWADPTTHRLLVDASVTVTSVQIDGNDAFGDGARTVTTAGTRVQLSASSVPCRRVYIQALVGNTGSIYVGGSTIAAGRGIELLATATITLEVSDLNLVYLDSSVNGEGVSYAYEN